MPDNCENAMVVNRRKEPRRILREPAEVAFYMNSGLHWGSMVDLSIGGARFEMHITEEEVAPPLSKGRGLDCCITMPTGTSKCKGIVRWTVTYSGILEWGISFTEVAADEDDPLKTAIRDYFRQPTALERFTTTTGRRCRPHSRPGEKTTFSK